MFSPAVGGREKHNANHTLNSLSLFISKLAISFFSICAKRLNIRCNSSSLFKALLCHRANHFFPSKLQTQTQTSPPSVARRLCSKKRFKSTKYPKRIPSAPNSTQSSSGTPLPSLNRAVRFAKRTARERSETNMMAPVKKLPELTERSLNFILSTRIL